jgi:diacylglycerol kinase (ATP)
MLNQLRDAVIIYNPHSGRRRHRRLQDLEAARKILHEAGIEAELETSTGQGSATALARTAVERGRQLVIACGGDGTINEIVNGLAGSQVPLAVLPAGTANVLAKELGLPWNIPAAARRIPSSSLRRIALGQVVPCSLGAAQRYFLCIGGAGPDGAMMYSVHRRLKERTGIVAYWLEGLRHLFTYRFPTFEVAASGRNIVATLLVAGRSKNYGGPFRITTGASLLEPSFELAVFTSRSRFGYLLAMFATWMGALRRLRSVEFWKATEVRCNATSPQAVYVEVDGEVAGKLPVEFRIVPDALTLLVPEGARL